MENLQVGLLSVLIALSGWIHDGLKAFEAKKYDDAVTNLTKVIEKDIPENKYRDVALLYRAKSYHAKKETKKALTDLLVLLRKYKSSTLVAESRKLYKELGGDMKQLLPAESPKQVWLKFIKAVDVGDVKAARALSTGMWLQLFDKQSPEEIKKNMDRDKIIVGAETIGTGEDTGTATLILTTKREAITMQFELNEETLSWQIAGPDMENIQQRGGRNHNHGRTVISNVSNLKQIGLACRMYSNDNDENFPPNLNALKITGFLENEAIYLWANVKTGKQLPFIYAPGHHEADSVDTMLAAAPKAVNGKREVLWLDGHVKTISEKEFIKNAKAQKWRLKGLIKKEEVPEPKQKKAKALIAKLADNNFDVRKKAKAALIKMGDDAYPFLEENQNHSDPEVKMTIKEILEGK